MSKTTRFVPTKSKHANAKPYRKDKYKNYEESDE